MEQIHAQNSRQETAGYQPVEDYTVIGDLHTVALAGKNTAPKIHIAECSRVAIYLLCQVKL